ncbi:MAG: Gfo/Idh/MocA family oxidoreductase [bacterium]
MKTLSVGIIGLQHLHPRSYMPLFKAVEETRVVAVAEPRQDLREGFAKDFDVRGYPSWEEMIDKESLDLVAIFLPHVDCPDVAVACAEKGLHLIVEKPIAAHLEGAQKIAAAVEKAGVNLSTPYTWRYHPVAREMKRLIDERILGRVVGCEGRCAAGRVQRYIDGHAGWILEKAKSGGGPMYNLGVHWIDLFRWFLSDEVCEVQARNVKINTEFDIEDNSFALLTFRSGTVLSLDISYTVPESYPYGRDLYLGLRGTKGVLSWSPSFEGIRETLFLCSDAEQYVDSPRRHIQFELESAEGYCGVLGVHYIRDIARCILEDRPVPINEHDAIQALRVVEAVYTAAETGRAVELGV